MRVLLCLLLLVSCGKKEQTITYVDSPFDNSKNEALGLIQDARLTVLENKINDVETLLRVNKYSTDQLLDSVLAQYNAIDKQLADLEDVVNTNEITIVKICNSGENLIKTKTDFYAVYMVSNNFGTYLGKLENNVAYQTTDNIKARFTIVNNEVVCE